MPTTEANVSWNDGSNSSPGRQMSSTSTAPPSAFNEAARRPKMGASAMNVNIKAARRTDAPAPTATV